jgi:hypothetical protein
MVPNSLMLQLSKDVHVEAGDGRLVREWRKTLSDGINFENISGQAAVEILDHVYETLGEMNRMRKNEKRSGQLRLSNPTWSLLVSKEGNPPFSSRSANS